MKNQTAKHIAASKAHKVKAEAGKLEETAKKIMNYIEARFETVDTVTLMKYTSLALLAMYGIRKSKTLGSFVVPMLVGLISEHYVKGPALKEAKIAA